MMNNFCGYLLNVTKYKDYDLICEFLTKEGVITFINRGGLRLNSKLNCRNYRLCYLNVELYKGNQKYFMIKDLTLIKSIKLNNVDLETISFYNFLSEITTIFCKYNSFSVNLFESFENTLDSICLNESKYFYLLSYFIEILNENGVIKITKDFYETKQNLIIFFQYNNLYSFLDKINEQNIKVLNLNNKDIQKEEFKNGFFILTLIYESSFNQKLNSSELIYII